MSNAGVAIVTFAGTLLAAFLACLVAHRIGWLHFGVMEKAHQLSVTKATSKVGCSATVEQRGDSSRPTFVLHLSIYNDGDLGSTSVTGYWRFSTPLSGARFYAPRPIHIDILGKQPFEDEYCVKESVNWPRHFVEFEVEVQFEYTSRPTNERVQYRAAYAYDVLSGTMVRR